MAGFFDAEEEKKISSQFWNDGVSRRITATKEWRPGKSDPTKELCYIVAYDVDTKTSMTFLDFAFLNALKELPPDLKYDNHILKVTPQKTGEREYNGKMYDTFTYSIEATGDFYQPENIGANIPF